MQGIEEIEEFVDETIETEAEDTPFAVTVSGIEVYPFPVDEHGKMDVPFDAWDSFSQRYVHAIGVDKNGHTIYECEVR